MSPGAKCRTIKAKVRVLRNSAMLVSGKYARQYSQKRGRQSGGYSRATLHFGQAIVDTAAASHGALLRRERGPVKAFWGFGCTSYPPPGPLYLFRESTGQGIPC